MEAAELNFSALPDTGELGELDDGTEDAETSRCCVLATPGALGDNRPPARFKVAPGPITKLPPYSAPAPIASPKAIHGIDKRFP